MPFHNPYNFIPAPDRGDRGAYLPDGLRDGAPAGHHRWHDALWSGDIAITIRTVTPLLTTCERQNAERGKDEHDKHRHLDIATTIDHDGVERVDLAPTQIKGMLRSAYEAITCSRFGVFEQPPHLGYRTSADDAVDLRPARLLVRGEQARVLVYDRRQDRDRDTPAEVAKVPAWLGENKQPSGLMGTGLVANGAWVVALVAKRNFAWTVQAVLPGGTNATKVAVPNGQRLVSGRMHVSGPNAGVKWAERLIILKWWDGAAWIDTPYLELPPAQAISLAQQYRELVAEQRDLHKKADRDGIEDRDGPLPWEYVDDRPGGTAWSRHLYDATTARAGSPPFWIGQEQALPADGASRVITCWAQVKDSEVPGAKWIKRPLKAQDVAMLRPVMISRLVHANGPKDLLEDSVRPALTLPELSAADRVFGWVAQQGKRQVEGAHRGQLRVVGVSAQPVMDAVEQLEPLTIEPLSGPKPSQGRFYLGARVNGLLRPLGQAVPQESYFRVGHVLRGRKVYPHQDWLVGKKTSELRAALTYQPPEEDGRRRRERDSQNATLHQWVKPGVAFRAVLRVDSLNNLELGALLWLLDPVRSGRDGRPGRLKLGSGKPLGFGSVEVTVDVARTRLSTGRQLAHRLRSLSSSPETADWSQLSEQFEEAMTRRFGGVLDAFRHAAVGFAADVDVHYPRPYQGAPGYEWFVDNEKASRHGKARSLPLLGGAPLPERP